MQSVRRSLVKKGASYREQNCTDNKRLCKEAVSEYKRRWSTREGVNVRAFLVNGSESLLNIRNEE